MFGALTTMARAWFTPQPSVPPPPPEPEGPSVQIVSRGLTLDDEARVQYVWWQLSDPRARLAPPRYRVMMLSELKSLPIESRDDPDMMGKSLAALRGLYRTGHDCLFLASGYREPNSDLVVSQLYGAAAEADSREEAVATALDAQNAVLGVMSNFFHSRLQRPQERLWGHIQRQMTGLPHMMTLYGYPDPRAAKKGLTRDGQFGAADDELASPSKGRFSCAAWPP